MENKVLSICFINLEILVILILFLAGLILFYSNTGRNTRSALSHMTFRTKLKCFFFFLFISFVSQRGMGISKPSCSMHTTKAFIGFHIRILTCQKHLIFYLYFSILSHNELKFYFVVIQAVL